MAVDDNEMMLGSRTNERWEVLSLFFLFLDVVLERKINIYLGRAFLKAPVGVGVEKRKVLTPKTN